MTCFFETIKSEDRPLIALPKLRSGKLLTALQSQWDFDLRVIAQTTDTRNDADEVYTGHAKTTWQWDASGTFVIANDQQGTTTFTSTGGISAPGVWAAVQGETPFNTGPAFNTLVEPGDDIWD